MAARLFNEAWGYLDRKDRSPEENAEMLNLAHASRYHWGVVGSPVNLAVGDWQISRVYASLKQPELSLRYARLSLSICKKNGLGEMLPSAYEAMARAYAVARDPRRAAEHLVKARQMLDGLTLVKHEREIYLGQIRDTQHLIDRL